MQESWLGVPGDTGNRLLDALPAGQRVHLVRCMRAVPLRLRQVVHEQGHPIEHVVFPLDGVISLVVAMEDGSAVETATVGREGLVGLPVCLTEDGVATHRAVVQIQGEGLAIDAAAFLAELGDLPAMRRIVAGYANALLAQVSQSVACNGSHTLRQRCARWLLQTGDRVGSECFYLTQEFFAQMLGVRRASVTVIAGSLRDAGLIRYRRGRVEIVDRPGLEALSCECYRVVRDHYQRLIPGPER
ncbi:MAG TPA: Crp/Fnr family transcriptional regulator [Actinomycetota bacterium]|jgi:CRP-like cAMP-binding protein|nr:Crp/Fnr family transcriptional regulator [Actinomycetota bacterium]